MASIKEGLVAIANEILEDAKREAEKVIREAEKKAEEILKRAKEDAEKIRNQLLAEAKEKGEIEKKKILSQAEIEAKSRLLEEKERLVNEAFSRALARLKDFIQTEGYHDCLLQLIRDAAEKIGSDNLVIYVNSRDRKWLVKEGIERLRKELDLKLRLADETLNCLGGCIVKTSDGKVSYDNTFEKRLERLKHTLRIKVAKILFGEEE
ncbi:hypothetical protein J7K27_00315 [Candidatus Bathyarchaeota archaeon]|nr:hypothetical protein [Candidatus Bathyarchaeota archaeon]